MSTRRPPLMTPTEEQHRLARLRDIAARLCEGDEREGEMEFNATGAAERMAAAARERDHD